MRSSLRLVVSHPPSAGARPWSAIHAERLASLERLGLLVRVVAAVPRHDAVMLGLLDEAIADTSRLLRALEQEAARAYPRRWAAVARRRVAGLGSEWTTLVDTLMEGQPPEG